VISALLLGRKGSVGFPGKNIYSVLGHPLSFYPMNAAKKAKHVNRVFLSTDDVDLMKLAQENGVEVIERPDYLCTKSALGEDAYVHGFREIVKREGTQEFVVLLFCNAATITAELIDKGIEVLRKNSTYDSAVTVSKYNMWSPLRARKIDKDGLLQPVIPFTVFGDAKTLNCDRDSQGDIYFADMGVSVVRPKCLENIENGMLPQKWMGQKIYPLMQWGGCDIDYEWQIPQVEFWLKENNIP